MQLQSVPVVVTGGSKGLGLGITEALVARGARVTVVARDGAALAQVRERLGVDVVQGDVTDPALPNRVLSEVRPRVLVLNAGTMPRTVPILEQTWDSFTAPWDTDVKAAFHWSRAALTLPLDPGSRIVLGSSGAAVGGSPLSGGYAGAKRMIWFLAGYLDGAARELGLDLKVQAILPQQLVVETAIGRHAVEAYAARKGVSVEAFLDGFGPRLTPARVGELVRELLEDPDLAGTAYGLKTDGLRCLDA